MLEIIAPALIVVLTEIVKRLNEKYGQKLTKAIIIVVVFLLALLYAYGSKQLDLSYWLTLGAQAIAIYEVVWKMVLKKVFEKYAEKI